MANLKNPQIWIENVGDIMRSEEGEIFWMLPQIFISTYETCVTSPYFKFELEDYRLAIMPSNGNVPILRDNRYWGLFLWKKECNALTENYDIRLCIKTHDGKEKWSHTGKLDAYGGFGKWNFLLADPPLDDYVFSGRIRICCLIEREEDIDNPLLCSGEEEENKTEATNKNDKKEMDGSESKGVDRLIQNFASLLDCESGYDVILKTIDHEFHAHRIILSVRSPVFSSMFQHDMVENRTGEIDISDCSTEAFKVFLQYLYSGTTDTISPSNVLDLYYISDKYQVIDLKCECVDYMKANLAVYNFCDVITLSLRHNESDLYRFATRFFCINVKKIIKTLQWQKYITKNPIQANELFTKAINA